MQSQLQEHLEWLNTRIEQALEAKKQNIPIPEGDKGHDDIIQVLKDLKEVVEEALLDAVTRVK